MTRHSRRTTARTATGLTVLTIAATAGLSPAAAAELDES